MTQPVPAAAWSLMRAVRAEWPILGAAGLTLAARLFNRQVAEASTVAQNVLWFLATVAAVMACAFRAMRHADDIAERVGEPGGTIVLTLSAITIEVALVVAVMLSGQGDTSVARDTMYSVLMCLLTGLIGLSIVVGGLRRREQTFNLRASGAYLSMILAFCFLALVLPTFSPGGEARGMSRRMEIYLLVATLGVYGAFLWHQMGAHREFFMDEPDDAAAPARGAPQESKHARAPSPVWYATGALVMMLGAVILLAEGLGDPMLELSDQGYLPRDIEGAIIALVILAPEGVSAVAAAGRQNMQRTVNILLGSALSTLGLTIPALLVAGWVIGQPMEIGLDPLQSLMLLATLFLCALTLTRGRVNVMQGLLHLLFFGTWILLQFEN